MADVRFAGFAQVTLSFQARYNLEDNSVCHESCDHLEIKEDGYPRCLLYGDLDETRYHSTKGEVIGIRPKRARACIRGEQQCATHSFK